MSNEIQTNSNAVSFNGMVNALHLGIAINKPTIFLGTFGIAKSAGIAQTVERLGRTMVDFRAGEILPEDIGGIGIPVTDEQARQVVMRAVPDIVHACETARTTTGKDVVLFLDEITSAVPAVQAALFQVLLDRRAGTHMLPENTYVVAAGNLATDRSIVEELARPLLNRAMVYTYTGPTFEEFDSYMSERDFHPIIRTFLKVNTDHVVDKINPENEQSPTPRSWETASDLLHEPSAHAVGRLTALSATVGGEAAANLETYLTMNDKLVPFSEIMANPDTAYCPTGDDFAPDYMQTVALAAGCNRVSKEDADKLEQTLDAAWTYAYRMPIELGSVFVMSLKLACMALILKNHKDTLLNGRDGAYAEVLRDLR